MCRNITIALISLEATGRLIPFNFVGFSAAGPGCPKIRTYPRWGNAYPPPPRLLWLCLSRGRGEKWTVICCRIPHTEVVSCALWQKHRSGFYKEIYRRPRLQTSPASKVIWRSEQFSHSDTTHKGMGHRRNAETPLNLPKFSPFRFPGFSSRTATVSARRRQASVVGLQHLTVTTAERDAVLPAYPFCQISDVLLQSSIAGH